jgi:hypothetical protein
MFGAWLQVCMFDLSTILEVAAWGGFRGKQQEIRPLFLHKFAPPFVECLCNQEDSGKMPQNHTIATQKALWGLPWIQLKVSPTSLKWIFSCRSTGLLISIFRF